MESQPKGYFNAFVRLRSSTTGGWLVHPDLRAHMITDAEARGSNMTDVAAHILGEKVGVSVEPSTRRSSPSDDDEVLLLRLPVEIAARLKRFAGPGRSMQDVIRYTLCEHYRLPMPPRRRRSVV